MRVVSNDGGAFVLENAFKTMKIQSKVRCASDGSLIQEQYSSISGANTRTQTLSFSGVAFPSAKQWVISGQWAQSFKIKMIIGLGNPRGVQLWTVKTASKTLSSENVSVPAGKFTALKVAQTIDLELVTQDDTTPMKSTETTIAWYARGIGVVKSSSGKFTSMLTDFVKP